MHEYVHDDDNRNAKALSDIDRKVLGRPRWADEKLAQGWRKNRITITAILATRMIDPSHPPQKKPPKL